MFTGWCTRYNASNISESRYLVAVFERLWQEKIQDINRRAIVFDGKEVKENVEESARGKSIRVRT